MALHLANLEPQKPASQTRGKVVGAVARAAKAARILVVDDEPHVRTIDVYKRQEVGEGTNIGAGVITCNYDGVHKHTTKIGRNVFVGSDSTLVAPVTLEDGSYIGAGSCITRTVPAGSLAIGRAPQITKEGWALSLIHI